jgi:hypothetical protein
MTSGDGAPGKGGITGGGISVGIWVPGSGSVANRKEVMWDFRRE